MNILLSLFTKFIIVSIIIFLYSCGNEKNYDNEKQEIEKIRLVEETPPVYTAPDITENIGKINYDSNTGLPKSNNKTTTLKTLARLVKANPKSNSITINYNMHFSPDYAKDWKVVYNRTEKKVYDITISTNIKDVYENITDDVIISAAKDKECLTLLCLTTYSKTKMNTDYSERKIDAVGMQPAQSDLDGSVKVVAEFIKANSKESSSIKFIEWSKVTPFGEFWIVRCKFQGTNSLGAVVTENKWFFIQKEKVVKTKSI